jgi:RNA polymerase-binding transcription factor
MAALAQKEQEISRISQLKMQPSVRLSVKTVERYRSQLEQKRSALLRRLRLEADEEVASSQTAVNAPADESRPASQTDRQMMCSEVERALAAISDGTYGVCAECGEPIGPLRLNALPETRQCLLCAFP